MLSRKAKERTTVALTIATLFIVSVTISMYVVNIYSPETIKRVHAPQRITYNRLPAPLQKPAVYNKEMPLPVVVKKSADKPKQIIPTGYAAIPPIAGLQPRSMVQWVDAQQGTTLKSDKGSLVYIPPQAFVDAKGNPVDGKIKVAFTEYHNYQDIFMSGIPMQYKTKATEVQLESAAMMKLMASADNKMVYVNPLSRIKVMLSSQNNSKDFDLYYFDARKGNWERKGKDKVVYQRKKLLRSLAVPKVASYKKTEKNVYIYSFDGSVDDRVFLWWKFPSKEFDFRFTRLNKSYPELKHLGGIQWQYKGNDAKEVYSKLFNVAERGKNPVYRKGVWDKIELTEVDKNGYLQVLFQNASDSFTVRLKPADKNETQLLKVSKRLEKYFAALKKRHQQEISAYAAYRTDSIRLTNDSLATASIGMDVMRSFEIDNFGIWNVDKIANTTNFVAYELNFKDENGKIIKPQQIYVVDKSINSVFTYTMSKSSVVRLNPYATNLMWAILPGNKLAVVKPDQLWQLAGTSGQQDLTMQVSSDALTSIEDLR